MRHTALFICLLTLAFCLQAFDAQAEDRTAAFQKRHLIVTPPAGWSSEIITDGGLFEACVAYDQQDTGVSVVACPGFEDGSGFSDLLAEARQDGGRYVGKCFVQERDGEAAVYVPMPKNEGVILLLMDDGADEEGEEGAEDEEAQEEEEESIYVRTKPMLDAFKTFRLPAALFK